MHAVALALVAAGDAVVAAAGVSVFERVVPVELRTGVVHVRTVEAPLLEVPDVEGGSSPRTWTLGTWRNQRFSRLYAITFLLETRRAGAAPALEELGTLLAAVRADPEDLLALDDRIRAHLSAMGADAFTSERVRVLDVLPPFDRLSSLHEEPSWTCSGDGATLRAIVHRAQRLRRQVDASDRPVRGPLGSSGVDTAAAERLCPALARAAAAAPEELRTMPVPRELLERAVHVEAGVPPPEEVDAADLLSLPEGVSLARRSVQTGSSGESVQRAADGSGMRASWLLYGTQWEASTVASSLPPDRVALHARVSRWTLVETRRRLGPGPSRDERTSGVLTLALVPLAVPGITPAGRHRPELDEDALRTEVGKRLDGHAAPDLAALEEALTVHPEGLRASGAWMTVLCREDGTAWFGLPPTKAGSSVLDAALVCAALDARLP